MACVAICPCLKSHTALSLSAWTSFYSQTERFHFPLISLRRNYRGFMTWDSWFSTLQAETLKGLMMECTCASFPF